MVDSINIVIGFWCNTHIVIITMKLNNPRIAGFFMIFLIVHLCIRLLGTICRLRGNRNDFGVLALLKSTWFRTCGSHLTAHSQKQKPTKMVGLCFWWEYACTNRAENKQEFTELMHNVKMYKEKWL